MKVGDDDMETIEGDHAERIDILEDRSSGS